MDGSTTEKSSLSPFLGLRTVVYGVADLEEAKKWFTAALRQDPYFDESYYVGFNLGGYELGLNSDPSGGTSTAYWAVNDVETALAQLTAAGAEVVDYIRELGGGIRLASVREPQGNLIGLIENPHVR